MNTIKNAKFIKENADFGTVVPVFIKAIKPEKAIGKATLFCSALGSYEAYINGKRIGDFFLHRVGQPMANAFMGMGQQKR